MSEKKVVRVEIEYADGEVIRVTGEEAERWSTAVTSSAVLASIHGFPEPVLCWKTVVLPRPVEGTDGSDR